MKKTLLPLFAAALVCLASIPEAQAQEQQNNGYYARALEQQKARQQQKKEPSLYGDLGSGTQGGFSEAPADEAPSYGDDSTGNSFNQMMGGSADDAAGIHSYLNEQESENSTIGRAENRRTRTASDAQKRRDEMIKKMKANSDKLLKRQKDRAWRLAHPGQEPPDTDGDSLGAGYDDTTGGADDNGDWGGNDKDDWGGGGDSKDGWGGGASEAGGDDWGGGGDGFSGGFDSSFANE